VTSKVRHGRSRYNKGCRCDQCKCAESEYRKGRRRELAESVGEFAVGVAPDLRVVHGGKHTPLSSENTEVVPASSVEAAVSVEIEALGAHHRPGLAAAALALARILDKPEGGVYSAGRCGETRPPSRHASQECCHQAEASHGSANDQASKDVGDA
jgi:hypothetical protein